MTEASPRGRTSRLPRTARRAQLLQVAQEVFVENGYHVAAMDDIADRAGVSKPVLYQHFPGKLELYLAILDTHVHELVTMVEGAIRDHTENKDRVSAVVKVLFDFVDRDDAAFRVVFESDLINERAVRERVDQMTRTMATVIADVIGEDTGLERAHAEVLGSALAGMAQYSARAWLAMPTTVPREQAIALIAQLAWRGIAGFPRKSE